MRKAFHEWAFNLFTKRITVKVSKLPNDDKIQFLTNRLMNELQAQGHNIQGKSDGETEFVNLFCIRDRLSVSSNNPNGELWFKRQRDV